MNTIADDIREAAKALVPWLGHEPGVRPDFRGADPLTVAAIIAILIGKGIDTAPAIYAYLVNRECRFDFTAIQFLLDAYEGFDRRRCVWARDYTDRFELLDY